MSLSPSYAQAPSNALQLYYRFDSVSGSSVGDIASGSVVYNAILQNGAVVSNNELMLSDAKSQYMSINSFTTGNGGLTFASWWRSDSSGNWARIMDFGNGRASDNIVIGNWDSNLFISPGSQGDFMLSFSFNTQNNWNHVAWTLDPSGTSIVYINGVQLSSQTSMQYPRSIVRSSNYIGRSNWDGDSYFNGGIKDFRMYSRVLSASEVNLLFTSTQTIFIGSSQCWSCPAGQYSSTNGSTSCSICSVGKSASFSGSKTCSSCNSLYSGLGCFDSGW